jgi:two-component system LytT family response regulator
MKKEITCLVVDDEPFAQDLLCRYIDRLSYLSLVGVCKNALEALEIIRNDSPNILFLDINMPEISGMEMVRMLNSSNPYIIFTTAYSDHAAESYDFEVTDYLVKPISFERFVRAVNKVSERMELRSNIWGGDAGNRAKPEFESGQIIDQFFMVRSDKKLIKINLPDIVVVEGMKDYLKIHLTNSMIIVHMTVGKMEEVLRKHQFLRISKSYIVNIRAIKTIEGNELELSNSQKIPIGGTYRDAVFSNLQGRMI